MPAKDGEMPKDYLATWPPLDSEKWDLEVTWGKGSNLVRIGLAGDNGWQDDYAYVGDNPDSAHRFVVNLRDRQTVNDAIRLLKRARDQAFGRDE